MINKYYFMKIFIQVKQLFGLFFKLSFWNFFPIDFFVRIFDPITSNFSLTPDYHPPGFFVFSISSNSHLYSFSHS